MQIYRIARSQYIRDLSGTGSKLYGGRWNPKGTPILYCAENRSLALLEILVHFDGLTIPPDLQLLSLIIQEDMIDEFSKRRFKKMRFEEDSEFQFKRAGDKWLKSNKSLILKVPSVVTQDEYNYLINPMHPEFSKITRYKVEDLILDERLFR